jgi:Tol biopolymer transport system component
LGKSEEASITALPISADGTKVTGPAERLTFGTGTERHASAASGLLALSAVNQEDHIWGVRVDAGGHATGAPRQVTSGGGREWLGYLSRDGQKLVFTRRGIGHHPLHLKHLKTAKEEEIPCDDIFSPVLSPDTARIAVTMEPTGFIYEVPVSGGVPRKIWGGPIWGLWDWSPDGSTILFFSNGGDTIEEVDITTNLRTVFLSEQGYKIWQAHFSPDGAGLPSLV